MHLIKAKQSIYKSTINQKGKEMKRFVMLCFCAITLCGCSMTTTTTSIPQASAPSKTITSKTYAVSENAGIVFLSMVSDYFKGNKNQK